MAKKKTFWISYDLGIKGDYNSLYSWLDKYQSKECGNSLAFFQYNCKTNDIKKELKEDLEKNVSFNKTDRIYLIYRDDSKESNVGVFLIGNRKPAPWEGYFSDEKLQEVFDI